MTGRIVSSSSVSPELERASTTSAAVIMPMSPWLASAGCRKNAGVPVLASVAAILLPTWPGLAHAGDDHLAGAGEHQRAGPVERGVEPVLERGDGGGLGGEDAAAAAIVRLGSVMARAAHGREADSLQPTGRAAFSLDSRAVPRAGEPTMTADRSHATDPRRPARRPGPRRSPTTTRISRPSSSPPSSRASAPSSATSSSMRVSAPRWAARSTRSRSRPTPLPSGRPNGAARRRPDQELRVGQAADPGRRAARRRSAHFRRQERRPADPRRRAAGRRAGHDRQRAAPAGRHDDDRAARPHGRERHGRRTHAGRGRSDHDQRNRARRTSWSRPCARPSWCWARWWPGTATPTCRCPAAAPSARGR